MRHYGLVGKKNHRFWHQIDLILNSRSTTYWMCDLNKAMILTEFFLICKMGLIMLILYGFCEE